MFRGGRAALDVTGKTVILVDDGLATGGSMAAANDAVRNRSPAHVIAAVPIASPDTCAAPAERADQMICLHKPDRMYAVGLWYEDFTQTEDAEVRNLLDLASRELRAPTQTRVSHARR